MKKYICIIAFFFCLPGIRSKAQQPDPVLNQLLAIDESQFLNKPVDSIIAMLQPVICKSGQLVGEKPQDMLQYHIGVRSGWNCMFVHLTT